MKLLTPLLLLLPVFSHLAAQVPVQDSAAGFSKDCAIYAEIARPDALAREFLTAKSFSELRAGIPADLAQLLTSVSKLQIDRISIGVRPKGFFRKQRWFARIEGEQLIDVRRTAESLGIPKDAVELRSDGTLLVADSAKSLAERVSPGDSLALDPEFQWFREQFNSERVKVFVNLERVSPMRAALLKPADAGATFFLGHLLATAAKAPAIGAALDTTNGLAVKLRAKSSEFPKGYEFLVPKGDVDLALAPKHAIARLSLRRDLKEFWNARDAVGQDGTPEEFAKFRSQIETLLGDLAFDDLIDSLGTTLDFYAALLPDDEQPSVRYPMGALVVTLRDAAMAEDLILVFQSVIGLQNIERGMMGRPRFLMESAQHRGVALFSARHLLAHLPTKDDPRSQLKLTIAAVNGRLVFGSHPTIVRDVIEAAVDGRTVARGSHDALWIDGPGARTPLLENADLLAGQRVLNEGGSLEEARQVIARLLQLTSTVEDLNLELRLGATTHALDLTIAARSWWTKGADR